MADLLMAQLSIYLVTIAETILYFHAISLTLNMPYMVEESLWVDCQNCDYVEKQTLTRTMTDLELKSTL